MTDGNETQIAGGDALLARFECGVCAAAARFRPILKELDPCYHPGLGCTPLAGL